MAQVTDTLVNIRGQVVLTVTYDDVTLLIDEFVLVTDRTVTIQVIRNSNGQVWREATVDAGTYTYTAGGPIKRLDDLERIAIMVDF
jgi:hypothetical protein